MFNCLCCLLASVSNVSIGAFMFAFTLGKTALSYVSSCVYFDDNTTKKIYI